MKALSNYQLNFLLKYFFTNDDYPGWKNVATKLLTTGKCIVAGQDEPMWIGGIGNFIKTEPAEDAVFCTLYTFDLKYFLTSEWYKEIKSQHVGEIAEKKKQIDQEYKELVKL